MYHVCLMCIEVVCLFRDLFARISLLQFSQSYGKWSIQFQKWPLTKILVQFANFNYQTLTLPKILPNITKHCQTLPNITKHYQTLPNIAKHYQTLPNMPKHYQT